MQPLTHTQPGQVGSSLQQLERHVSPGQDVTTEFPALTGVRHGSAASGPSPLNVRSTQVGSSPKSPTGKQRSLERIPDRFG